MEARSAGGRRRAARSPAARAGRRDGRACCCDPRGSSLQSCLKLLPKSPWTRRQRRCRLCWPSRCSPRGLSWGRPGASSPQVSGPDGCPRAGEGSSLRPGTRAEGSVRTPGVRRAAGGTRQRARWPPSCCRLGRGAPGRASAGAGNFCLRAPLFPWRLAASAGRPRRAGGTPCCSRGAARLGVQRRQHGCGDERGKVVTTAGTATPRLVVQACCSRSKTEMPPAGSHSRKRGDSAGRASARCARCFLSRE